MSLLAVFQGEYASKLAGYTKSEVLAIAGESPRLGDPECPPTEHVPHAMGMVLYRHDLLRRRLPPRVGE